MRLRLSLRAQGNLARIAAYIVERNPTAAHHVQEDLTAAFDLVATYPHAGRAVQGGRRRFALPRYPYVIIYRVDEATDQVTILTVRHAARRPQA